MDELNRPNVQTFKAQKKLPITVILDNVRSLHNVGSVFRTADGFAVEEILLIGITAQPPHREIEKTALGATQSVSWRHFPSIIPALEELQTKDYTLLAVEQVDHSTLLNEFKPDNDKKYALIFGNEVHGVSDEAMQRIDGALEIPQFGTKHSFNIVISAGIVLWDFYQKLSLSER